MLKQVSIYAENRKGTMQKITAVLLQENINILGSVTNDSAEYGIGETVCTKNMNCRYDLRKNREKSMQNGASKKEKF